MIENEIDRCATVEYRRVAASSTGVPSASPTASGRTPHASASDGIVVTTITLRAIVQMATPRKKVRRNPIASVEYREIVESFARTNEPRRNSKFILNRNHNSPFAAAVEFGNDETSDADGVLEFARLTERVAASRCIHHQQRLVRRVRVVFAEGAFHLLQLGHQIRYRVLATGRIAKQKVDLVPDRRLIRLVTNRSRVGIVLAADHFDTKPFGPNAELLDSCGAKSVSRRQHHTMSILLKITSQFGCRRCLSCPVYTQQ